MEADPRGLPRRTTFRFASEDSSRARSSQSLSPRRTTVDATGSVGTVSQSPSRASPRSTAREARISEFVRHERDEDLQNILRATVGRQVRRIEETKGVKRDSLLEYVQEARHELHACLHLPLMILYFVAFSCAVTAHEDLTNTGQMDRKFRGLATGNQFEGLHEGPALIMGHKTIDDVDTVDDAWRYLEEALLERFIPNFNAGASYRDMNRIERTSRLIGGLELQQQRRREVACKEAYPDLGPKTKNSGSNPLLQDVQCYPWNEFTSDCISRGSGGEDGGEGFCPDRLTSQALPTADRRLWSSAHAPKVRFPPFKEGLYTVTLHQHEGLQAAKDKIHHLKEQEWLDKSTAWFGIKAFMLTPDLSVYTHLAINVWFAPSGEAVTQVRIGSFPAEPYNEMAVTLGDAFFAVLWFHLLFRSVGGLLHALFFKQVRQYLTTIWTWTEWVSMLGGVLVMVGWFLFLRSLGTVRNMAMDVAMHQPHREDGWVFASALQEATYNDATARLHTEVSGLADYLTSYRVLICWYTVFLIVRFFEAFGAQPRLAIVTNTLSKAFVDIGHFLVVLCATFCTFAVAGVLLFGHRTLEFSQLHLAINQCFLIMMGAFDYALLSNEHQVTAGLWFFLYSLSVSVIMLNMALAIVMDIYSEVIADSEGSETIWSQAVGVVRSFCYRRDWCSLYTVEMVVRKMDEEHITVETLLEAIPGMPPVQAEDLLDKVEEREERNENKGLSLSDATRLSNAIHSEVEEISSQVNYLIEEELEGRADLAEYTKEYPVDPDSGKRRPVRFVQLDKDSDHRLHIVEKRLLQMQERLSEAMRFTVGSAKEMRHTLTVVEDLAKASVQMKDITSQVAASPR